MAGSATNLLFYLSNSGEDVDKADSILYIKFVSSNTTSPKLLAKSLPKLCSQSKYLKKFFADHLKVENKSPLILSWEALWKDYTHQLLMENDVENVLLPRDAIEECFTSQGWNYYFTLAAKLSRYNDINSKIWNASEASLFLSDRSHSSFGHDSFLMIGMALTLQELIEDILHAQFGTNAKTTRIVQNLGNYFYERYVEAFHTKINRPSPPQYLEELIGLLKQLLMYTDQNEGRPLYDQGVQRQWWVELCDVFSQISSAMWKFYTKCARQVSNRSLIYQDYRKVYDDMLACNAMIMKEMANPESALLATIRLSILSQCLGDDNLAFTLASQVCLLKSGIMSDTYSVSTFLWYWAFLYGQSKPFKYRYLELTGLCKIMDLIIQEESYGHASMPIPTQTVSMSRSTIRRQERHYSSNSSNMHKYVPCASMARQRCAGEVSTPLSTLSSFHSKPSIFFEDQCSEPPEKTPMIQAKASTVPSFDRRKTSSDVQKNSLFLKLLKRVEEEQRVATNDVPALESSSVYQTPSPTSSRRSVKNNISGSKARGQATSLRLRLCHDLHADTTRRTTGRALNNRRTARYSTMEKCQTAQLRPTVNHTLSDNNDSVRSATSPMVSKLLSRDTSVMIKVDPIDTFCTAKQSTISRSQSMQQSPLNKRQTSSIFILPQDRENSDITGFDLTQTCRNKQSPAIFVDSERHESRTDRTPTIIRNFDKLSISQQHCSFRSLRSNESVTCAMERPTNKLTNTQHSSIANKENEGSLAVFSNNQTFYKNDCSVATEKKSVLNDDDIGTLATTASAESNDNFISRNISKITPDPIKRTSLFMESIENSHLTAPQTTEKNKKSQRSHRLKHNEHLSQFMNQAEQLKSHWKYDNDDNIIIALPKSQKTEPKFPLGDMELLDHYIEQCSIL